MFRRIVDLFTIFAAEVFSYLKEIIVVMQDIVFSEGNLLLSSLLDSSNPLFSQRAVLAGFVLGNLPIVF
jgi:hypothetical protein